MKNFKRFISLVLALVMSFSLMTAAFAADGDDFDGTDYDWDFNIVESEFVAEPDLALVTSFKDVKTTAWYYKDVTEYTKLGIIAGFSDGTFKPDDKVTDVQFLVMMTRTFFNNKVEAVKAPAGSKWYYANIKVAEDTTLNNGLTVTDTAMSRYNMALVLYNELVLSGKKNHADSTKVSNAKNVFKDWDTMELKQKTYVKYCYALDILAGMADGTFSGNNSMTRAQACTVIMRMLKLVNNYNPGDADNDQYDDGKNQNPGNQSTGKLANGKDATAANVQATLDSIKRQYPEGTTWGLSTTANTNAYAGGTGSVDVKAITEIASTRLDTRYACGGFAAMVSDTIFGQSGVPAR